MYTNTHTTMEALKITLTETKDFELIPFGHFTFTDKIGRKANNCKIRVCDISYDYHDGMPCKGEAEKAIIALMIKHKTDVLTNPSYSEFYTRLGKGLSRINHPNIRKYKIFLFERKLQDDKLGWLIFKNS